MRQIEAIEKAITEEVGEYSGYLLQAYKYTQRNSLEELTFDDLPWGNFINSGIEELVEQMKELGIKEFWVSEISRKWYDEIRPQLDQAHEEGKITGGEWLYIYNMCDDYHYERFMTLVDRMNKSKNHCPSDIATKWDWNYYVTKMEELNQKCLERLAEVNA